MKTKVLMLILGIVLGLTSISAQVKLRRLPNNSLIYQIGYQEYTPLAIGSSPNSWGEDYGAWFIEHFEGGLNFCKPWGSTSPGNYKLFLKDDNGFVGIGAIPSYKLHVTGDIYADGGWLRTSGQNGLYFESYGGGFYMLDATWIRTFNNKSFYHNTGIMRTDGIFQVGPEGDRFVVQSDGKVGIGVYAGLNAMLTVNGKIECEEVEVKNISSDFVFKPDYKLLTLKEVEQFIKSNGHLPAVPPAEVTEKGVNIAQFSNILLQKVEELTLYVISLQKENEELRQRVEILEK